MTGAPRHQGRQHLGGEVGAHQAGGLRHGEADGGAHVVHALLQGKRLLDGSRGDPAARAWAGGGHLVHWVHSARDGIWQTALVPMLHTGAGHYYDGCNYYYL